MATQTEQRAIDEFQEHLTELADTYYDGDQRKAFRHAAFSLIAPDPTLSDEQVIELTAIDQGGDLEIDGWFVDEQSESVFLFQSTGGNTRIREDKVAKFWNSPDELLNSKRVAGSNNQLVKELSRELNSRISEEYSITMVLASKGGFVPSARAFATSRTRSERELTLLSGESSICRCTFRLVELADVAQAFDDYRAGFRRERTDVRLQVNETWTYVVDRNGPTSIRATVPASEIVRIFQSNGYKLFELNPRDPIANAKVNKRISNTLDTVEGRRRFHILNNGMCATCDTFDINDDESISVENLQIVNGCQTTVTLSKRTQEELSDLRRPEIGGG